MKQGKQLIRRWLTFALSLAMVFTSVNIPAVTAAAAERKVFVLNHHDDKCTDYFGETGVTVSYEEEGKKAVVKGPEGANNWGGDVWGVQIMTCIDASDLTKGKTYNVSFDLTSNVDRTVFFKIQGHGQNDNIFLQSSDNPDSGDFKVQANQKYTYTGTTTKALDVDELQVIFALGKYTGEQQCTVTIENLSFEEVETQGGGSPDADHGSRKEKGVEIDGEGYLNFYVREDLFHGDELDAYIAICSNEEDAKKITGIGPQTAGYKMQKSNGYFEYKHTVVKPTKDQWLVYAFGGGVQEQVVRIAISAIMDPGSAPGPEPSSTEPTAPLREGRGAEYKDGTLSFWVADAPADIELVKACYQLYSSKEEAEAKIQANNDAGMDSLLLDKPDGKANYWRKDVARELSEDNFILYAFFFQGGTQAGFHDWTITTRKELAAATVQYKVEHYQQNLDLNGYTKMEADTDTLSGKAGTTVNVLEMPNLDKSSKYVGFELNKEKAGDASGELREGEEPTFKLYYDRKKYSISYELNQGTQPEGYPKEFTFGKSVDLSALTPPTRKGYKFGGWYTDTTFHSPITEISGEEAKSYTLYAKWEGGSYQVEHYLQNLTLDGYDDPVTETISDAEIGATVQAAERTYTGFSCVEIEGKTVASGEVKEDNSLKLKLYYNRDKYKITYMLNDGTDPGNPSEYVYGIGVKSFQDPAREGYTFAGWYTDEDYLTRITSIAEDSTGEITMYARWKKNAAEDNSETVPGPGEDNTETVPGPGEDNSETVPGPGEDNSETKPGSGEDNTETKPGPGEDNTETKPGPGEDNTETTPPDSETTDPGNDTPDITNAAKPTVKVTQSAASVPYKGKVTLQAAAEVADGGTLSYQWYKNTSATTVGAEAIEGATGAVYDVPTNTTGDRYYFVVVANANNAVNGEKFAVTASEILKVTVTKLPNPLRSIETTIETVKGAGAIHLKTGEIGAATFTSSKPKVATVNQAGKITIKGTGRAVITVAASGDAVYDSYTAEITVIVAPKKAVLSSVKSKKSKTVTVKWKKDTGATGYEVQYSSKKNFKGATTVRIKKARTVKTTIKKKLKGGKQYYIRVRAYKNDGGTITGEWSKSRRIKVKK